MRLALLTLLLFSALAAGASASMDAGGAMSEVPILAAGYGAPRVDILAGDTVTWRNDSVRIHSVAATDGTWASAHLVSTDSFSHRFDAPGAVDYYCQLHPFMRGEVDVHRVLLTAPREAAAPGRPLVLAGRAALPAGSTVSIQADGDAAPAATATVDAAGEFRASVTTRTTTSFRALAGDEASPPVQVLVLDRTLAASAAVHGRTGVISVGVAPASPGATVELQVYERERFGWWPVQRTRLDGASHARFRLRLGHPVRARVRLISADGTTEFARSAVLKLR
jgi:plastocyanin